MAEIRPQPVGLTSSRRDRQISHEPTPAEIARERATDKARLEARRASLEENRRIQAQDREEARAASRAERTADRRGEVGANLDVFA